MGPWQLLTLVGASVVADGVRIMDSARAERRVDACVEAHMRACRIPGVALGVMREGKLIKASGYGLANVEQGTRVTPETVFETASVGKQFTAVAVMMLVECGSVRLDDRITKYFPEGARRWKDITVRDLLSHTSGIPEY